MASNPSTAGKAIIHLFGASIADSFLHSGVPLEAREGSRGGGAAPGGAAERGHADGYSIMR